MTTEQELKRCPFCGADAELIIDCDHHGEFYYLGCSKNECLAKNMFYTESETPIEEAIEAWNGRV